MYQYNDFDHAFVRERVRQFSAQVERRISGALSEEEVKPLRLMNGLYLQLHAYMLRVAIPYGTLNSAKLRKLADIAERWDKGYGHFTTRQNVQFNWPKLKDVPKILEALAEVEMHAIQTSGNCIRNVTADHFAGAARDEIEDPRPIAELLRQWSTDHPEFQFLPRKFKIAVSGSVNDRAVVRSHDIGLEAVIKNNEIGYRVFVGGGLGRTPMEARIISEFTPKADLLPYIEAIVHIWNKMGRRDNKYKARIKILIHEYGLENFKNDVEEAFIQIREAFSGIDQEFLKEIEAAFAPPNYKSADLRIYEFAYENNAKFRQFIQTNITAHKQEDYAIVSISTKPYGGTPGDVSADQMRVLADIAERFGHDELRISHEQNVVLPHVHKSDLPIVYKALKEAGLGCANMNKISDIIACPGMDYCSLATARSIPIAQEISTYFREREAQIGELKVKISGCINACGHHHVGHIGILGLDRAGVENYQITLGGDHTQNFALGERTGPGFDAEALIPAIDRILSRYLEIREEGERFIDTYRRVGMQPFKEVLYQKQLIDAA